MTGTVKKTAVILMLALLFGSIVLFSCRTIGAPALAASADYTITKDNCTVPTNKLYGPEEGYTVKVSLPNSLYNTRLRVVYSAWKVDLTGVDTSAEDYDASQITQNAFIKDKDGNDVSEVQVSEIIKGEQSMDGSGRGSRYFNVTLYDNCAVRFDMYYYLTDSDVEEQKAEGEMVFCTDLVDSYSPTVFKENDGIFIDGGYRFTVTMRGNPVNTLSTANSGLKSYEFFRVVNNNTSDPIIIKSSSADRSFTAGQSVKSYKVSVDIMLSDAGNYYMKVEDNVGNVTVSFLATMESTTEKQTRLRAAENFIRLEGKDYLESDLEKLEKLVSAYAVATDEEEEAADAALSAYQKEITSYTRDFAVKVINPEYIEDGEIAVADFDQDAVSLFKGQKATLQLGVAMYESNLTGVKGVVDRAKLKTSADRVFSINISQIITRTSSEKMNDDFLQEVKVTVPISKKYKEAVALCFDMDTQEYVTMRYDKLISSVIFYVKSAPSIVYIVLSDGKEGTESDKGNLNWLYSLFALIPLGVALFFFIKKNKGKKGGWKKVKRVDAREDAEDDKSQKAEREKSKPPEEEEIPKGDEDKNVVENDDLNKN